jgi:hypothetical protein
MPLRHILGVDHVVVTVRELDAAAAQWRKLGFTVSPRGTHSPQMGTANHTMMFDEDYLELVGVLQATEQNQPTRELLEKREGIERTAFTTDDAAAGADDLKGRGLTPLGPVHFGRPVDLPNGQKSEARFSVFRWPLNEAPGGMRIFACQHLTRDTVWIPEMQRHPNSARQIAAIEILATDPRQAAAQMSRLIDEPAETVDGGWRVSSGGKRADFLFYDVPAFAARYPDAVRVGAAPGGATAVVIGTADLAAAAKALGAAGIAHHGRVSVPAHAANGVIVSFVA